MTTAIEQHASMVTGRRVFEQQCGRGRHGQRVVGRHAASQTSPVEALGKNPTSPPTQQELFGALFSLFVANRTPKQQVHSGIIFRTYYTLSYTHTYYWTLSYRIKSIFGHLTCPSLILATQLQNRVSLTIELSKLFPFDHLAILKGGFAI